MPSVGLLDVSGIQSFVFRSNKLKQIAEASNLIEKISERNGGLIAQEAGNAGAEVVAVAAGNATLTAENGGILRNAFRAISRALLERGEGLQIVCAICDYAPGGLARACQIAQGQLEQRKLTQPRSTDFVFSGCDRPKPLDSPAPPPAVPWLVPKEKWCVPEGWAEPQELDEMLGDSGEEFGLMAVVSIDGIGMGKRLLEWSQLPRELAAAATAEDDEQFAAEFTAWSESLKRRWRTAWEQTLDCLTAQFVPNFVIRHGERELRANNDRKKYSYLPCRRIYHGGDDLCFVCDARIALGMAAHLARTLEKLPPGEGVPEEFHNITAGIGVVFVDAHFPFVRAVQLSGEVLKSAKKRANEEDADRPPSTIDWWVNRTGAMKRTEKPFSLKPYLLHNDMSSDWNKLDWTRVEDEVFGGLWKTYAGALNKLKDLLEAAEDGPTDVQRLLQLRPLDGGGTYLSFFHSPYDSSTGFNVGASADQGRRTPLLDAGELYDIHFPFSVGCEEDTGGGNVPQD